MQKTTASQSRTAWPQWALALLLLITLAVYARTLTHDFINLDDPDYVTENGLVRQGLTAAGIKWAFTTGHASNWHPITWLSHMADVELFGMHPWGHHLTNVLLHAVNTVLVFAVFFRMTRAGWRSALLAAAFALHPLHVESVAWIAERKDLLSGCFGLLTLLAYVHYVQGRRRFWYAAALIFFALGLMSKPMLVTLPFVLLLLDWWPLDRLTPPASTGSIPWTSIVLEKVPFLLLTAASCIITFQVQQAGGAVSSLQSVPVLARISNAALAYVIYLIKTVWPSDLSVIYPIRLDIPGTLAALAAGLTLGVSFAVWWKRKLQPYWFTGWFWFVGMLVPVIGLVQVGVQSMADRYTYLPLIGIFAAVIWSLPEANQVRVKVQSVVAIVCIAAWGMISWQQLGCWAGSIRLFEHALAVTSGNYIAHNNLGSALLAQGQLDAALEQFRKALEIKPSHKPALFGAATVLREKQQWDAAAEHLKRALALPPPDAAAHVHYAMLLTDRQDNASAIEHYRQALALQPNLAEAHNNLAHLLLLEGKVEEARKHAESAVALRPDSVPANYTLANTLFMKGNLEPAARFYEKTLQLDSRSEGAHLNLGKIRLQTGQIGGAAEHLEAASRLNPNNQEALLLLGRAYLAEKNAINAVTAYRRFLALNSDQAEALNNLAWLLATQPDPSIRNGSEAVRLATRACELTGNKEPGILSTLAAAHAANGEFPEAIRVIDRVITLQQLNKNKAGETAAIERREQYRAGKAIFE